MQYEGCKYQWHNQPRIITYTNPKRLKDNLELAALMKESLQLCASDTLMQGLISRYGRDSFGILCSVEHFQENVFDYELTGARQSLQIYLDVKDCIDRIPDSIESRSSNCKNAFNQNIGDVAEAFRFLAMTGFELDVSRDLLNDEQRVFFDYIYDKLIDAYRKNYKELVKKITVEKIKAACIASICTEVSRMISEDERQKIKTLPEAKRILLDLKNLPPAKRKDKSTIEELIETFDKFRINTVIIHGVVRFTPEIMMLIEALDKCGISVVFVFNYCSNLEELYSPWKHAYSWVGCDFENVKELNLSEGREPGRAIAEITMGKRSKTLDCAKYKKYVSLTEFTDSAVRKVFERAQKENPSHPLANMNVQYYSIDAGKPNDILRNYFPEQFLEKPFMAYPVGQFIRGLFEMWDFEKNEIKPDFRYFKDCSLVKIAHSRDDMFSVLNKIEVYFKDIDSLKPMINRTEMLVAKLNDQQHFSETDRYLSFYDVSIEQVSAFKKFVQELNGIGVVIFGSDSMKRVDYQERFRRLIHEISTKISEKEVQDDREHQLLSMLEESLNLYSDKQVVGGIKSLKEAIMLYLQVKQNSSEAKWIVRGFDQLDGAPLMRNAKVNSYEIAGLSMKQMTKSVNELLPWPLSETVFFTDNEENLYSYQAKTILKDRNDYLRFYLFYAAFFSDKDLIFSFIENENDEKQRPYFMLGMLGLVPVDSGSQRDEVCFDVIQKKSSTEYKNQVAPREKNIFSICPYKYFLFSVLKNQITYKSEYHIRYFLETEKTREMGKNGALKQGVGQFIDVEMQRFHSDYPFFDEAELSDIRKFINKNFKGEPESADHIQKKRDFLIAQWKENETKYMNFNKSVDDVRKYMSDSRIMPTVSELPHKKICQECCFSSICLNNYYDKEVDV